MADLVAVYGTLKHGMANFDLLRDARFLGTDLLPEISLYDLGPWPGAKAVPSEGIEVEVFDVSQMQIQQLDELEEYVASAPDKGVYDRRRFITRFGSAWVYLYNPSVEGLQAQRRGAWRPVQDLQVSDL